MNLPYLLSLVYFLPWSPGVCIPQEDATRSIDITRSRRKTLGKEPV
jgi:hypothetical protein